MLITSYIYYIVFNVFICIISFGLLRLYSLRLLVRLQVNALLLRLFIYTVIVFFFITLLTLQQNLKLYETLTTLYLPTTYSTFGNILLHTTDTSVLAYGNSILYVYAYPFIYIFLVITVMSVIYCLTYNSDELQSFMLYILIILVAGYVLFYTDSLLVFFFAYEMLLVPSFFILYKYAKTRRTVEAAYLMFFWTQFGALFLIFSFLFIMLQLNTASFTAINLLNFTVGEVNFIFVCCIIGFGVKLPIWPFYGWLPKAHVEASTNFSIFLSGVLVKFAFFGLIKCLFTISLEPTIVYIYPFLFVGIIDAVMKLFYQVDLKKLVAYSTVVEMHWLTICIVSGQTNLLLANFCMLISHALLSTNSFLLVDAVARRFKTRLITEVSGLNFLCPKLFLAALVNTLIFLGFPGSIFFVAEVLFFSFSFDLFPTLTLLLIPLLYLIGPTFYFKSWMSLMFGNSEMLRKSIPVDLTVRETLLFFLIPALMYWLGFTWHMFLI